MKISKYLLSAFAAMAVTASATAQVAPKPWTPQNPQAGVAMYANVKVEGQQNLFIGDIRNNNQSVVEFSKGNDYDLFAISLSNLPKIDQNSQFNYSLIETPKTVVTEVWHKNSQIVVNPGKFDFNIWTGLDIEWPSINYIPEVVEGKTEVINLKSYKLKPTMVDNTNVILTDLSVWSPEPTRCLATRPVMVSDVWYQKGTYMIAPQTRELNFMEIAFISSEQYEFHKAAQIAADYVNASNYTGSSRNQLVQAIETEGKNWVNQKKAVEDLLAQFKADEAAVKAALDAMQADYTLGVLDADKTVKFNIFGTNGKDAWLNAAYGDSYNVTVDGADAANFAITNETGTFSEETSKEVAVTFNPSTSFPYGYNKVYNATVNVNVAGLTKAINVKGYNPAMSWNESSKTSRMSWAFIEKGTRTSYFYAYGYKDIYGENEPTIEQTEGNKDEYVATITKISDGRYGANRYALKIEFLGKRIGANDAKFVVKDSYGISTLTLNVQASQVALSLVDDAPIYFPAEGGEKTVAVNYEGFTSINAYRWINAQVVGDNANMYTVEWLNNGNENSNCVNGSGTIYAKITAKPIAENVNYDIKEAKVNFFYGKEANADVTVNTTKTLLSTLDGKEPAAINLGGDNEYEAEFEFATINLKNFYTQDDIKIYTNYDVFKIDPVYRTHEGMMIDDPDNAKLPYSQQFKDKLVTVTVKYIPAHADTYYEGELVIENVKTGAKIIVPLTGAKTSQAKIIELNGGTTGVSSIETENALEGPAYNVAGQRVNNSAKGVIIINGKKYVK